jgi:hypothetical protein
MVLNGRIRTKGIAHPRRERVLVRKALDDLGFRYRELVPYLNSNYHGWKGENDQTIQWLDFCVWSGKKMFVVLFEVKKHSTHQSRLEGWAAKKRFLEEHQIPYLVVSVQETSQVYKMLIKTFVRKENM